jgi:DNA mismatch endonuclease, patch repair protein
MELRAALWEREQLASYWAVHPSGCSALKASLAGVVTPPWSSGPDFAFRRQRVAVFVDGCFWHGCPKHSTMPANNRAFWEKKLSGNQARDRVVSRTLRREGWRVVRVWEHELRKPALVLARIRRVLAAL